MNNNEEDKEENWETDGNDNDNDGHDEEQKKTDEYQFRRIQSEPPTTHSIIAASICRSHLLQADGELREKAVRTHIVEEELSGEFKEAIVNYRKLENYPYRKSDKTLSLVG